MSATIQRLPNTPPQATSSAATVTTDFATSTPTGASSPVIDGRDSTASGYNRLQRQVWNWQPNESGLDMP